MKAKLLRQLRKGYYNTADVIHTERGEYAVWLGSYEHPYWAGIMSLNEYKRELPLLVDKAIRSDLPNIRLRYRRKTVKYPF